MIQRDLTDSQVEQLLDYLGIISSQYIRQPLEEVVKIFNSYMPNATRIKPEVHNDGYDAWIEYVIEFDNDRAQTLFDLKYPL